MPSNSSNSSSSLNTAWINEYINRYAQSSSGSLTARDQFHLSRTSSGRVSTPTNTFNSLSEVEDALAQSYEPPSTVGHAEPSISEPSSGDVRPVYGVMMYEGPEDEEDFGGPGRTISRGRAQNSTSNNMLSGNVEVNEEMTTVAAVFGHRSVYPSIEGHPLIVGTNLAGIEIELENIRAESPRFSFWESKTDGSLRNNGREFVSSSPWGGKDLYDSAIEIDGFLFGNSPDGNWRCSTHVHIDVRNMTAPQIKKMILAYIIYERVLFKCSGWHRYKNNFCVALGFAQGQLEILSRNWDKDDATFLQSIAQNWDKYSSMNLIPMMTFGSIEFRISEAKWKKGKLIRLVNRFLSLKELAMNFEGSDESFVEYVMSLPINEGIKKGLPKASNEEFRQDLEIGYKLAHDVISMYKIRRRNIYTHNFPTSDDGSRAFDMTIENRYWEHLRIHIQSRSDGLWILPEQRPTRISYKWLYELRKKCQEGRITFDLSWFEARSNSRQHSQLLARYISERNLEEEQRGMAPPAPPRPVSRSSIFESDDDEEIEDDDDEDNI